MRRKAWIAIRNGEIMPNFYLRANDAPLTPASFWHPEEIQIAGPVTIDAPPPPTDMVPMSRMDWSSTLGRYVYLV